MNQKEKHEQSKESLGDVVLDCLKAFDKVYSYEIKDDTSFEIWVHNQENDLLLFFIRIYNIIRFL